MSLANSAKYFEWYDDWQPTWTAIAIEKVIRWMQRGELTLLFPRIKTRKIARTIVNNHKLLTQLSVLHERSWTSAVRDSFFSRLVSLEFSITRDLET